MINRTWRALAVCASVALAVLSTTTAHGVVSTINSNFNGTAIPSPRYIWFNSHITSVDGATGPVTIYARNQRITFTVGGAAQTVLVPDAEIRIAPGQVASTTFDLSGSPKWLTKVPSDSGTPFLSGIGWQVPATGVPGGTNPVAWSADFFSSEPGVSIHWQWSAAVYTTFSSDMRLVGPTPVDGSGGLSQSGSPANFNSFVVGGARGGGGSNFTGSNSGTGAVDGLIPPTQCRADLNQSGTVTVEDLFLFLDYFFNMDLRGDFDGNGVVNLLDLFKGFLREFFDPNC